MTMEMPKVEVEPEETEVESVVVLGREEILSADDLPMELVEVPEWKGAVWVRTLGGTERDHFEATLLPKTGKRGQRTQSQSDAVQNIRARLFALVVCNDAGEPMFTPKDVMALGRKSAKALDRVFEVAQRLSGFSEEDLEDLAKNSESLPGDCSPSG